MFVPFVNLVMIFVLGARGNAWAWKNKHLARRRALQARPEGVGALGARRRGSSVIVVTVGFTFWIVSTVASVIKSSPPYQVALEEIRSNAEVQAVIGDNITDGFMPIGLDQLQRRQRRRPT